ncbi:MAG TPA: hypothetical protein VN253_12050 [Kofleriaceae bacterium]|nr:hypothetical protein [Kofleriaceae bacterium]
MVGFPSRRLAVGLFICGVVLGACKKDEPGKSGGDNGAAGGANGDLGLIPVDSDLVLGLNLAQARDSALYRDFVMPSLTKNGKLQALIEKLKTKCGFDPMTAVSSMTLGLKSDGEGVAVVHGLEKAKALPCVDQVKDELAQGKVEVTKDGDVVLAKGDRPGDTAAVTFVDDKTALFVFGPKANKAGALEVAQGKSALSSSKEFTSMYGQLRTGDTVWGVLKGSAEPLASQLEKLNVKSTAVFGSASVKDGLAIDLRMRVESEDQAQNVAKLIGSQVAGFEQFADKVEIGSDKADVRFQVSFTPEKLKTVLGFVGPMFRGRM